jgi:hypothetical protein
MSATRTRVRPVAKFSAAEVDAGDRSDDAKEFSKSCRAGKGITRSVSDSDSDTIRISVGDDRLCGGKPKVSRPRARPVNGGEECAQSKSKKSMVRSRESEGKELFEKDAISKFLKSKNQEKMNADEFMDHILRMELVFRQNRMLRVLDLPDTKVDTKTSLATLLQDEGCANFRNQMMNLKDFAFSSTSIPQLRKKSFDLWRDRTLSFILVEQEGLRAAIGEILSRVARECLGVEEFEFFPGGNLVSAEAITEATFKVSGNGTWGCDITDADATAYLHNFRCAAEAVEKDMKDFEKKLQMNYCEFVNSFEDHNAFTNYGEATQPQREAYLNVCEKKNPGEP